MNSEQLPERSAIKVNSAERSSTDLIRTYHLRATGHPGSWVPLSLAVLCPPGGGQPVLLHCSRRGDHGEAPFPIHRLHVRWRAARQNSPGADRQNSPASPFHVAGLRRRVDCMLARRLDTEASSRGVLVAALTEPERCCSILFHLPAAVSASKVAQPSICKSSRAPVL